MHSACNCAERTGELVVFTCPLCIAPVLKAMKVLTERGVVVKLDKSGSVSAMVEGEELYGKK